LKSKSRDSEITQTLISRLLICRFDRQRQTAVAQGSPVQSRPSSVVMDR